MTTIELAPDRRRAQRAGPSSGEMIVDCDIHPSLRSTDDLLPFMTRRWAHHFKTYGAIQRQPHLGSTPYPKTAPDTARRDAWPPGGGRPGSDLDFMRRQHLDPNGIGHGVLLPLQLGANTIRNTELGTALCAAINEWQIATWTSREPRLKGSLVVAPEDAQGAVAEIEKRAGDRSFVQVQFPMRTAEQPGARRYWPVFEAASRNGLPIGIHINTVGGGFTSSGSGWPSFYFQEHQSCAQSMKALLASFVFDGVFEHFPNLRLVLIEGGFGWVPSACWRMDRAWERMRDEVPDVRRPPSDYVREQVWLTTQPIEEPRNPQHLAEVIDWIGWDRLMFSSDYPHWDCDDARYAFPFKMTAAQRRAILHDNAAALYRLA